MIQAAQGEYSVFIDDDDRIADDYVDQIMKALYENPNTDCVVFNLEARTNGGKPQLSKYGIELTNGYYEPLVLIITPKEEDYESKLMRGEISPIDFTPVLEWAKKHEVTLSNSIPELFVIPYTS